MHVRDVKKPCVLEMRKAEAEMAVEALQTRMQGMRIPPDEEEQNGCWPTDDLAYFLTLRTRLQKKVKAEKNEGS